VTTTTARGGAVTTGPGTPRTRRPRRRARWRSLDWRALLWVLPALIAYAVFDLYPLTQTVRYSFYDWDGVGVATDAGFSNYVAVFTNPEQFASILHAFVLILFFTVIPVGLGLIVAAIIRELRDGPFATFSKTVLFLPQVLPLAAAGIIWTWIYAPDGMVNGFLRSVGLGALARNWLGDFDTALPAVGVIGSWVSLGFCTVLLLAGIGKIDRALYEAARLDGANRIQEFFAVTLPGLRREIVVACTVTIIAALSSFDVIYVSTSGGPGYATMVPGLEIYRLTFVSQQVGSASALAVVLTVLILAIVLPLQRLGRSV
jgi:raffinose/stachyose/melibiose transport system permease protein